MFFKRSQARNARNGSDAESSAAKPDERGASETSGGNGALMRSGQHTALTPAELRRKVDGANLGFSTTAELEAVTGPIGQERALKAIEFGASMPSNDFNVFVLGPPASGKSTAVKAYLREKAATPRAISDWVYVNNFDDQNKPRALELPCGKANRFEQAMVAMVDELRQTVPALFEDEDYQSRRKTIDDSFRSGQEEAFEALNQKAASQNIAIMRTPMGIAMAPMH
ncbi:MAG: Lon-like protease helical domain-containing protein, partial [Pseudomonadota bacterium]